MYKTFILLALSAILITGCTKRDYVPVEVTPHEWIRTHDEGIVAFVDFNGNYVIDTYHGFAVVEGRSGISPRENDYEYAYFDNRGLQSIYNSSGDYFTDGRVVESFLSWDDAMYILDQLAGGY